MTVSIPLASQEVRWFFEGAASEHLELKAWFEQTSPIQKRPDVGPVQWRGRLQDQPDVYLLIPGADDMGVKWREGDFQIKGRVSSLGNQLFCGRHQGNVENWSKWSYRNLPTAYRQLFEARTDNDLLIASVKKTRALRKVRIDSFTGSLEEVDLNTIVDRGLGFEFTELEVAGVKYCSLAFEGYPSDEAMNVLFRQAVEAFLDSLREITLTASDSFGYAAWLNRSHL